MLLCGIDIGSAAFDATGAHGAIMYDYMPDNDLADIAISFAHPTMFLRREDYNGVLHYYNTTTTRK